MATLLAQWDAGSTGAGLTPSPHPGSGNTFMEIDNEIYSVIILSIPLIQEGLFSVSGKRMLTSTG